MVDSRDLRSWKGRQSIHNGEGGKRWGFLHPVVHMFGRAASTTLRVHLSPTSL